MKTPEEILNEVAAENMINIQQMVTTKQLAIIAMKRYAKLYHDSEVKKLNIPVVMVELPCDEEIEQQARKVNEGDIDYGYVFGAKWMRELVKGN